MANAFAQLGHHVDIFYFVPEDCAFDLNPAVKTHHISLKKPYEKLLLYRQLKIRAALKKREKHNGAAYDLILINLIQEARGCHLLPQAKTFYIIHGSLFMD